MKIHPIADRFPLMTEDQLEGLAQDIKENGQTDPIVIWQESIIDGRNRLRACERAGLSPRFEERAFANDVEVKRFIISKNLKRRHLSTEQQRELIVMLSQEGEVTSTRAIAEIAGVSQSTVSRVLRGAGESGDSPQTVTGKDGKTYPAKKEPPTTGTFRPSPASAPVSEQATPLPNQEPTHETPTQAEHAAEAIRPSLRIDSATTRNAKAQSVFDEAEERQIAKDLPLVQFDPEEESDDGKPSLASTVDSYFDRVGTLDNKTLLPKKETQGPPPSPAKGAPAILPSEFDGWNTPPHIVALVKQFGRGEIALDPCSNERSIVDAWVELGAAEDGLHADWSLQIAAQATPNTLVYVNPPYDQETLAHVAQHSAAQSLRGCEVIALVPNKSDQAWLAEALDTAAAVCFVAGRVYFWRDGKRFSSSSAFPLVLFYWGRDPERFREIFSQEIEGRRFGTCLNLALYRSALQGQKEAA